MLTRVIAALALVPLFIFIVIGGIPLYIAEIVILAMALREFYKAFNAKDIHPIENIGYIFIAYMGLKNILNLGVEYTYIMIFLLFMYSITYLLRCKNNVIDIVSMDIKLPEHFNSKDEWIEVYENELKSIEVMQLNNQKYYIKIVVSPTTPINVINKIMKDINDISKEVEIIIQPVSPMELWDKKDNLFKISEIIGKNHSVSIIPQIHKYLNVE